MDGGNHGNVEEFGQGDSGVRHQPVVGMHHIGQPALGVQAQPGPDHGMPHGQRPGHHVASEVELVRVLSRGDHPNALMHAVGGRVACGVGPERLTGQHHHVVTVGGQRGGQMVHMPPEAADDHRRVLPGQHQDLHAVTGAAAGHPAPRTARRRGSSSGPGGWRPRGGHRIAHRRSPGWRGHAGARGSGRSRQRSPC